jgi:hyperosmotically inducible protein
MRTPHGFGITTAAAIAAALALAACDQRSNDAAARRGDTSTATAPAPDASQKIAAATDKATDKMAAATDKVATAVDDGALTTKVKAALLAEPGLKSLQISVDTKNGAVTLAGIVDTPASRDRAREVASSVSGVATVIDHLTVKTQG